ncbi:hypothetical protein E4U53_003884, partial [Claviceps sorghi]
PESMLATLQVMREEYGSVDEYVLNECGLTPRDIDQIRSNFIVEAPPPEPTTNGRVSRPAAP